MSPTDTATRSRLGTRLRHAVRAITGPGPYYDGDGIIILGHLADELDAAGESTPLLIPTLANQYGVTVSRPAHRVLAEQVQVGDVLLLDGYVSKVTGINRMTLAYPGQASTWPVLHITGQTNIVRFPHETISVIRTLDETP